MDNFDVVCFYEFKLHFKLHDILGEILWQLIARLRIEGGFVVIFLFLFWKFLVLFE